MREIVTVQVGGFANFVGSHFWNFQDELLGLAGDSESDPVFKNQCFDMNVVYRSGETQQGILTYTPRLVSVDLQGSLGCVSSCGMLYDGSPKASLVSTWTGNVATHASESHKKNLFLQSLYEEYQDKSEARNSMTDGESLSKTKIQDEDIVQCLETGVKFWTDFSKVYYHPKSLYELNGLWISDQNFDNYGIGRNALSGGRGEEINERLRFFVEECDSIQGIQFVVDDSGGFSSVAADFLENIADDYTNIPLLLYTVRGSGSSMSTRSQKKTMFRELHDAVSFSRLTSYCKLIVPVGLPFLGEGKAAKFLCMEDEKPYHSSAVYAAALYTISLPFRMELPGPTADSHSIYGSLDVNQVIQMLAGQARPNMVATLDVAMPAPSLTGEQSLLDNMHSLTPEVAEDVEDLLEVECMTIHGGFGSGGSRASIAEINDTVHAAYENAKRRPRFAHLSAALCPLPIPLPFPSIFGNSVGKHGELLKSPIPGPTSRGSIDVHSIPMAGRLRSSSVIMPFLESRLRNLHRFGTALGAPGTELLRSWGFGKEELEDMGEALSKMVAALGSDHRETSDSD